MHTLAFYFSHFPMSIIYASSWRLDTLCYYTHNSLPQIDMDGRFLVSLALAHLPLLSVTSTSVLILLSHSLEGPVRRNKPSSTLFPRGSQELDCFHLTACGCGQDKTNMPGSFLSCRLWCFLGGCIRLDPRILTKLFEFFKISF